MNEVLVTAGAPATVLLLHLLTTGPGLAGPTTTVGSMPGSAGLLLLLQAAMSEMGGPPPLTPLHRWSRTRRAAHHSRGRTAAPDRGALLLPPQAARTAARPLLLALGRDAVTTLCPPPCPRPWPSCYPSKGGAVMLTLMCADPGTVLYQSYMRLPRRSRSQDLRGEEC